MSAFLLFVCLCFALYTSPVYGRSNIRNPLRRLSTIDNVNIHTPRHRLNAYSSFDLTFDLTFDLKQQRERVRLSLQPNLDVLHQDAEISYIDLNGQTTRVESFKRSDHKVYLGQAYRADINNEFQEVGWARITILRDGEHPLLDGTFTLNDDHHVVQTKSTYSRTKHTMDPVPMLDHLEPMVVARDSDILENGGSGILRRTDIPSCNADSLSLGSASFAATAKGSSETMREHFGSGFDIQRFTKRQNYGGNWFGDQPWRIDLTSTIGDASGCPSTRRTALVGIAVDCTYSSGFENQDSLRQNLIGVLNTASDLYERTFNITFGLRDLVISDAACPDIVSQDVPWNVGCSDAVSMSDRLNSFSRWRASRNDDDAFWSLFTACNSGSEVGIAWLGQLCVQGRAAQTRQSVSAASVVARNPNEWRVFAHEAGHLFGAVHDCDSSCAASGAQQCCPLSQDSCDAQSRFMMNAFSSSRISQFSPCSIGNICASLGSGIVQSSCLTDNRNVDLITENQCGNGIVEEGEDCDCGGTESCLGNSCCNPATCTFTENSRCDPSSDACCTDQCLLAAAGTTCRSSIGNTESEGTCDGQTPTCLSSQDDNDTDGNRPSNDSGISSADDGSWFSDNRNWVIGVAASVGGLIFLALLACLVNGIQRHRRRRQVTKSLAMGDNVRTRWAGSQFSQQAPVAPAANNIAFSTAPPRVRYA